MNNSKRDGDAQGGARKRALRAVNRRRPQETPDESAKETYNELAREILDEPGDSGLADRIRTLNDDVSDTRKELFIFVSALVFVFVTNYSITARDLLAGAAVELPFIKLAVPLQAFFGWTPLALVAVHIAVLLRLVRLREKLTATRKDVEVLEGDERDKALLGVVSNFLAQLIVIKPEAGRRNLLRLVYVSVAFVVPFFALLAITVRALPLHDVLLTFWQNLLLAADVGVAAYLFWGPGKNWAFWPFVGVVVVTNLVLCVPDSEFDKIGQCRFWSKEIVSTTLGPPRRAFWLTALLFESEVNNVTRRRWLLGLSRNIVMVDDKPPIAANAARPPMNFRGRDLRYAVFDRSDLSGADFTAADLSGGSFVSTDLKQTQFGCAPQGRAPWGGEYGWGRYFVPPPYIGALLDWFDVKRLESRNESDCTDFLQANFEGADFRGAKFRWLGYAIPSLVEGYFPRARFDGVDLRGADFSLAHLSRASFAGANLSEGAKLIGARLNGADFTAVKAQGADFSFSVLRGARFDGADLSYVKFLAAQMGGAVFFFTDLSATDLRGAILEKARVWQTKGRYSENLAWIDLSDLAVGPPSKNDFDRLKQLLDDSRDVKPAADSGAPNQKTWIDEVKELGAKMNARHISWPEKFVWEQRAKILVAPKDSQYDKSYAEASAQLACSNTSYIQAISSFQNDSYVDSIDYSFPLDQKKIPVILDKRLQLLREPISAGWTDYGYYDYFGTSEYSSLLPDSFDLSPIIAALDNSETCPAAVKVPPETRRSLKQAAERRNAERAKKIREEKETNLSLPAPASAR